MSLPTVLTGELPASPVALLLDFDGPILESVALKIRAFLKIYENDYPPIKRAPKEAAMLMADKPRPPQPQP